MGNIFNVNSFTNKSGRYRLLLILSWEWWTTLGESHGFKGVQTGISRRQQNIKEGQWQMTANKLPMEGWGWGIVRILQSLWRRSGIFYRDTTKIRGLTYSLFPYAN